MTALLNQAQQASRTTKGCPGQALPSPPGLPKNWGFGSGQAVAAESLQAALEPGFWGGPSVSGLAVKHPGGLWDEKRGPSEEITIHSARGHTFLLGLSSQTEKTAISPENSPKPIKAWVMLSPLSQHSSSHQTEPEITAITFPSFVSVNLSADHLHSRS